MDCPCAEFRNTSFSHFSSIAHTDADDCYTDETTVGASNEFIREKQSTYIY